MNIQEIINFLLLFIVLGIGVVCYSKLTTPFKLLALTIPATMLLELLAKITSYLYKTNALASLLECLVLYILYSFVYFHLFHSRTTKRIVFAIAIAVIAFA